MDRRSACRVGFGTACQRLDRPVKIASGERQDRVIGGTFSACAGHAEKVTRSARGEHWLAQLPEFRLFVCFWGSMAALDVGRDVDASPAVRTVLVAVVVAGCSLGLRPVPALAVGVIGWLFVIGFVVNDGGALRLTGVGDLGRLVGLLGVAQACALAGRNPHAILASGARRGRDRRRDLPLPARAGRIDATVGKR